MFQNIRTGSMLYYLNSNDFKLTMAQVVGVGTPRNKSVVNGQQNPMMQFAGLNVADMVVDISIKIDGEIKNIEGLPLMSAVVNFGNGIIIADSKEAISSEIGGLRKQSSDELSRTEYNKWVIEKCDEIELGMNPQLARDKAYEDKISLLEDKVMRLTNIIETAFLSNNKKTKKNGNDNIESEVEQS